MEQLLTTKLFIPPTRPELVHRPRLLEQLNDGLHRKLTLISAPAGFGKTTLLAEWVADFKLKVEGPLNNQGHSKDFQRVFAWLSLDEGDNDPTRFLRYFIAALNHAEGKETTFGKGAQGMLQTPQPPSTEAVLTALINEISAISNRVILILDDYHLIEAQPLHEALTFLLEHLPPNMHLVIATREDPPLPLSRLRARGQLTELRAADIRFTSAEAVEFLNRAMGLNLSPEDIASLETRTEGWIAGLQLAAISMQGHANTSGLIQSFTGSHRLVLDYLIEEVLDQQPEDVQAFLLQTAILNRLTGSLCDALTEQSNGQATLEGLDRANLFIVPLDEERRWYRYHHLLVDLLQQRLRQIQPELLCDLHCRASVWYEQEGYIDDAIVHALHAEDFARVAALIEEHVDALWQRGEHTKLRSWLAELPVELVFSKPHLCILQAWDLFTSGQQEAAERSLQAAEKGLETSSDLVNETSPMEADQPSRAERNMIQGRAAAIRAFLAFYRGAVQEINQYSYQALEFLPTEDLTWRSTATVALGDAYSFIGDMETAYRIRSEALEMSKAAGNIYMILIASMKLAVTMRQQGRLEQALDLCQQQLQLAKDNGLSKTVVVGWLLAIWGEVLAELNDLDGAIKKAKEGVKLTERGRDVAMIGWSYLCLMRVLFSRRELAAAEEIIKKMENVAREYYVPPWIINLMAAWQARMWLAEDKLEVVDQWVRARELDDERLPTVLNEMEYIVLARSLVSQGRLDEATGLLQRLYKPAERGGRTTRMIEILILQALASQAKGDTEEAMTALQKALTLAERGGFIRIFVDEGPPMARLLYEAPSRGIAPKYVTRLLGAFPVVEEERTELPKSQALDSVLVEPLSEREIEVLHLIAEGLTNQEIATRLYISLNTVKVHARNISGKLDAHTRTEAVAKARAFGILPSL